MRKGSRIIELASNVAIVILAIIVGTILLRTYLFECPKPAVAPRSDERKVLKPGEFVPLQNVDWHKNKGTLLLALSTTCHFCTQSGPFYQRLVKEHGDTTLIALLPQQIDESKLYLKRLGVELEDVRQASFAGLGISGTPTLVLVNNDGKVSDVWTGALAADKQEEIVRNLQRKAENN
jgi:hypothetical protein